jgi:cytochrome c551/c552
MQAATAKQLGQMAGVCLVMFFAIYLLTMGASTWVYHHVYGTKTPVELATEAREMADSAITTSNAHTTKEVEKSESRIVASLEKGFSGIKAEVASIKDRVVVLENKPVPLPTPAPIPLPAPKVSPIVSEPSVSFLIVQLQEDDQRVQEKARDSLLKAGSRSVSELIALFKSQNPSVRCLARDILVDIRGPSVHDLIECFASDNRFVRRCAQATLVPIGEASIKALTEALDDRRPSVAVWARSTLDLIQKKGPPPAPEAKPCR